MLTFGLVLLMAWITLSYCAGREGRHMHRHH